MKSSDWFEHLAKEYAQGFPAWCGFEVLRVDSGIFETMVVIQQKHLQQDGFVHAGVMATLADHTAGYAAFTKVSDRFRILSIEFKINFLKPAKGEKLLCRSRVVSAGKSVIVAESDVFAIERDNEKQVAKAMVTLMAVPREKLIPKSSE